MATDERLGETISTWLEATAPRQVPGRVLEATFEQTRRTRQRVDWRELLRRPRTAHFAPMLGAAAVVIVVAAVGVITSIERPAIGGPVATPAPGNPFLGTWVSSSDADGGTQTMTVSAGLRDAVEIVVTDDIASVCAGTHSTMTGTGWLDDATRLVIPAPAYTCDDGSTPTALSGPPLSEQLRNLTFVLDAESGILRDNFGGTWLPDDAEVPPPPAGLSGSMWPQSSLEEVRRAQALADAGDPAYTWQVSRTRWYQPSQHHPIDAGFFARFFEQALGWEDFRWDEAFAHRDDLVPGDVLFVRCAPGGTNPLYPSDTEGGCGPTIDDLRYETVKVHLAQLDRQDETGVWVVTGWEPVEPAAQTRPPSEAEIAALLEDFLQARIDGEGAEQFTDVSESDPLAAERAGSGVPLLYATSTGAPYQQAEFEVVEGPAWPGGQAQVKVRLFADDGATVVEQLFSIVTSETGRVRLVWEFRPMWPEGPVSALTENGEAVPEQFGFLDGTVTYRAASPLEPSLDGFREPDRLALEGVLPDDGAPRRVLLMLADPRPIGPDCAAGPAAVDAEALARSIAATPALEATAPIALTIGGVPALEMDVRQTSGACGLLLEDVRFRDGPFVGDRARLFLVDLPGGSERILVLATITDADSFETVLGYATPVVDSIELHAP